MKKQISMEAFYIDGISRNSDALIPVVGVKLSSLRIGVSYDQVTSGLGQEGMKNVYELSLSYIFKAPASPIPVIFPVFPVF